MTSPPTPARAATTPAWKLYRALVGFGVLAAALVAIAYELTAPTIAAKRLAVLAARVLDVAPGSATSRPFLWSGDHFAPTEPTNASVWAAYDDNGKLVAVAIEAAAMGYQDQVEVLFGYHPNPSRTTGFTVVASRETPGLGDRIGRDAGFLAAWAGLELALDEQGKLLHLPELARAGQPRAAWQVDGLSGATISSRAATKAVAVGASTWVPRIASRIADFDTTPATTTTPGTTPVEAP